MKVTIENDVLEMMKKTNATCLIVEALWGETGGGCGSGRSRGFYSTDVREGFPGHEPGEHFEKYEAEGVDVFINRHALPAIEGDLRIFIEKNFFTKRIAVEGIRELVLAD